MKTNILFLAAFSICFVLVGIIEAQQDQGLAPKSIIAVMTLPDGSEQEQENVESVYPGGKTLTYFKHGERSDNATCVIAQAMLLAPCDWSEVSLMPIGGSSSLDIPIDSIGTVAASGVGMTARLLLSNRSEE